MEAPKLLLPDRAIRIPFSDLPAHWLLGDKPGRIARSIKRASTLSKQLTIEIPDGSIDVDAPDLPQPTGWSCALVGASFARLYGVGPDSITEFLKGMGTKRGGTNPSGIVKYLRKLGLKPHIERNMTNTDLKDLLDDEIGTILALQAWADDQSDYDDPNNNENGHYAGAIGYATMAPQVVLPGQTVRARKQSRGPKEDYFFFMDPSILCRYGYMSWTNLDRRWHDNEGTRRKPRPTRHMGIVVDPNGHEPIHATMADEML